MRFGTELRRWGIAAHVIFSVGWLGAVAAFLALAAYGFASADTETAHGVYTSTDLITKWLIVPLCIAATITGVVQAMGTPWGLVRHYWVLIKLTVTILSTLLLLMHLEPISWLATRSASALLTTEGQSVRLQLLIDAGGALVVLLVMAVLGVIKPQGETRA